MAPTSMTYNTFQRALDGLSLPAACVDMDALDANIDTLMAAMGQADITLRVASKSVRHVGLLKHIMARGNDRFRGLMTFSTAEVPFLLAHGFDDFLMGYPVGRMADARILAEAARDGATVVATVDAADQCGLLNTAAVKAGVVLDVCIDIDVSLRLFGGAAHLGVRRSPIRGVPEALALADVIEGLPGLRLNAALAYEAQIAGMREHNPTSRHLDPVRRLIRSRSRPAVLELRAEIVDALRRRGSLEVVNGGGTGSIRFTSQDPSVTEVTAGSGFLCPHLFDGSGGLSLRPAGFFAIPVVRRSDKNYVTCAGGGYVASGETGADRSPIVHQPKGLEPLSVEGWGEVQTPFEVADGVVLGLGDPVVCRHAKAGELAERFGVFHLMRGGTIVDSAPTFRGEGQCFM